MEVPIPESAISDIHRSGGDIWDVGEATEEEAVWDSLETTPADGDTIN